VVISIFVVIMAELTQRQQERIAKSSSDRLRTQLVRSGVDEDEVVQMDRGELKAASAQIEAEKPVGEDARQKPFPDEAEKLFRSPVEAAPRSHEYEVLKMKLELRKMELEAEARQAEAECRKLEAEARKIEADKEARKVEAEARKAEAEREAETHKTEREAEAHKAEAEREVRKMELKKIELQARVPGGEDESGGTGLEGTAAAAGDNSLTGRTKKFGDALRHVLPHMPSEHAELPQFFDTAEKLFTIYQVPADVQAKLLIPILSSQANTIIGRMTSDDLMSYDKVKQFLLTEFRLTPYLALQQILSSIDLFLFYRTDYTDSRTMLNGCTGKCVRLSRPPVGF